METLTQQTVRRNTYGAILPSEYPDWVKQLLNELDGDEDNNAWETGVDSDRKGRGSAVNVAVYGWDDEQQLAVVQVRLARFHPRRYTEVLKNYYLCGRNENGNAFAHSIESPIRSKRYLNSTNGAVVTALCKIWDCKESQLPTLRRNGDVAFIEEEIPKNAERFAVNRIECADSHILHAENIFVTEDRIYVHGKAKIQHTKHQHPTQLIRSDNKTFRVMVGIRASEHDFSKQTRD